MKCPNCGFDQIGPGWKICPMCGEKIPEPSTTAGGFSLNLGDANAISGGINLSDSHNVDSHNVHNEMHNETHNETHNTYITQQERQKSAQEIAEENLKRFRLIARDAYEDGRITEEENISLMSTVSDLKIDRESALRIMEQEQAYARRRIRSRSLNPNEVALIRAVQASIKANDIEGIKELLDNLALLNTRVDNGEVQFFYYMLMAALFPNKLLETEANEKFSADCFWKTIWLSVACRLTGLRRSEALDFKFQSCIADTDSAFPGNIEIASAIDYLTEAVGTKSKFKEDLLKDIARASYENFANDHQSFLNELGMAIKSILEGTPYPSCCRFYMETIFRGYLANLKAVIDKKEKEEAIFKPLKKIPPVNKIGPLADIIQ